MGRRIAFFVGKPHEDHESKLIRAMIRVVRERGWRMDIFSNFGSYADNLLQSEGERNILNLPYLEDYDGFFAAPDSYGIDGFYETLSERILAQTKAPLVCLRCRDERFHNVLVDDRRAMDVMVSHFIEGHGFTRISFMTGRMDLEDAGLRLQGYRDAMERAGLPVEESMIFYGDYWRRKGREAVDFFLQGDRANWPQAIVCSNDFMALSVQEELFRRGIRVPADICVSGYDGIDEARYSEPGIAGIHVSSRAFAEAGIEVMERLFAGEEVERDTYIQASYHFNGSCGCVNSDAGKNMRELYAYSTRLRDTLAQNSFLTASIENCLTERDVLECMCLYAYQFAYKNMYICTCDQRESRDAENRDRFTDRINLRAVFRRDGEFGYPGEQFARRELLPRVYREEEDVFFWMPLHDRGECLGYIGITGEQPGWLTEFFLPWMGVLSTGLQKAFMYAENATLLEAQLQAFQDELTGIPNRRWMDTCLQKRLKSVDGRKPFYIISIDMDGLKLINDRYGHLEGDKALTIFAGILQQSMGQKGEYARVGGDEFQACIATEDEAVVAEWAGTLRRLLEEYNGESGDPYQLSASVGYALVGIGDKLTDGIQLADQRMYADKSGKKNTRRSGETT